MKTKFSYLGSLYILWMHDTPRDILASWVHVIDFKRWPCWYVRASWVKGAWKCGGAFVECVTLGRKSEQTLLRADGGMLVRRSALEGRPPHCAFTPCRVSEHWLLCSFSLAVVVLLCGAAPQKPWISACYSQHHSCWLYVGVAVDCKNTISIKEQNQCCLLLSCQLRLCHLYPCFIFINFIPLLNLLSPLLALQEKCASK